MYIKAQMFLFLVFYQTLLSHSIQKQFRYRVVPMDYSPVHAHKILVTLQKSGIGEMILSKPHLQDLITISFADSGPFISKEAHIVLSPNHTVDQWRRYGRLYKFH